MLLKCGEKVMLRRTEQSECSLIEAAEMHPDNSPFVGHWQLEDHIDSLRNPDHLRITLVDQNGDFAGFVILRGMTGCEDKIEIKRIVVTRKGNGLGRETLELLKSLAFEEYRTQRLFLGTRAENARAIHLYHSVGFIAEPEHPTSFHMDREDYFKQKKAQPIIGDKDQTICPEKY